jgi:MacB-like periplasmic core domain
MDNLIASNIRQRPVRTLVSVAGIALGVCLVMLFTGLARGMSNDLQRRSSNVRAEIIFTRPGSMQLTASTANLSTKYVDSLKQIEGVEEALPVIRYVFQGVLALNSSRALSGSHSRASIRFIWSPERRRNPRMKSLLTKPRPATTSWVLGTLLSFLEISSIGSRESTHPNPAPASR